MQIIAIASGLLAGALWALAFIAPGQVLPFGGAELTLLRYAVFGVSSLAILAFLPAGRWWPVARAYWPRLALLALAGNTVYYLLLSEALQRAGTLLPAMIIGMLPAVMPALAGLRAGLSVLRRLFWPALLILSGLALHVGVTEGFATVDGLSLRTGVGAVLALAALASWTFYGLDNAALLASFEKVDLVAWTALIGVATLATLPPVAALLPRDAWLVPAGHWRPVLGLVFWGSVLGLLSSWVATWLWNLASRFLSAEMLGYLIVSETILAAVYGFVVEWRLPRPVELLSLALLICGIAVGIRVAARAKTATL